MWVKFDQGRGCSEVEGGGGGCLPNLKDLKGRISHGDDAARLGGEGSSEEAAGQDRTGQDRTGPLDRTGLGTGQVTGQDTEDRTDRT
eukprot:762733-Hanusia_phi.AAC.2